MSDLSYRVGQYTNYALLNLFGRVTAEGTEHLPKTGPLMVMTNHISHFDPLLVGSQLKRPIDFMADKPLLEFPVGGAILKSWNAFPIDRTKADRQTVKTAMERLKAGRILGIFPEAGVRHGDASVLAGKSLPKGTVNLWRLCRCPALVGVIVGADQWYQWRSLYRQPRVFLRFAPLLEAPKKGDTFEDLQTLLQDTMRQLHAEIDDEYSIRDIEQSRSAQQRWAER